MKAGKCARCGKRILVPDYMDLDEEMDVCYQCDADMYDQWAEEHQRPPIEDTKPL